ncbi:hypothetical protein EYD45_13940 [Hyunsoonleella flava]|uniref:Uncharacterized protein n=2 Tax=Pseudomonadati TaxID=3379134 RepID=A0A4Q9FHJ5_9FLAO|nr:hypothetical protein [Hyunsoonleella flava]TBN00920.1 hypothetical protein EYD45_13940 [Hyunsoonleella flava]
MKKEIEKKVYDFFVKSNDFNGIPLRQISDDLNIEYEKSIDLIKNLVQNDRITIQSSSNPHIIYSRLYPIDIQLKILEDAKSWTVTTKKFGEISYSIESSDFPICLYPSPKMLTSDRNLDEFGEAIYSKALALAEPQLSPRFFEIEVLERYVNDPRFNFKFQDYSGRISAKYDENEKPLVRDEDDVFLKTFGLGFDENENRLAVVYLRYLSDLTPEHQIYWKNKERFGECKVLEEYYENTIKGNWTSSYSIFSAFIGELTCLNNLAQTIFSKQLFRKDYDEHNRPKEFTFFFTPTLKNYEDFVLLLDKMISDNINKDFFKDKVEFYDIVELKNGMVERKSKGTLRLMEDWLGGIFKAEQNNELKKLFKQLKEIRRERQNPAHKISENEYDKKYIELQKQLINKAYHSIKGLRHIFQQHPLAKDIEIPDWIENGNVKTF